MTEAIVPRTAEPMDEDEFKNFVQSELNRSKDYLERLEQEREEDRRYYEGRNLGNERKGRSKVRLTLIRDAVEWILPSLLRLFTQGDESLKFEPRNEDDIQAANEATKYAHWVVMIKNRGFMLYYTWFKDALQEKLGVIKRQWVSGGEPTREEYENIDDLEIQALLEDPERELEEHTAKSVFVNQKNGEYLFPESEEEAIALAQNGFPQITLHDAVFVHTPPGFIEITNVKPSDFAFPASTRGDIHEADFCAERMEFTEGQLLEMGVDPDIVQRLDRNEDFVTSGSQTDFHFDADNGPTRIINLWECYARVDRDGRGYRQIWKVLKSDEGEIVEEPEEVDEFPYETLTPIPKPHEQVGFSIVDMMKDLEEVSTTVLRQFVDGLYRANNPRSLYRPGSVDVGDIMNPYPGYPIAADNPTLDYLELQPQLIGPQALDGLAFMRDLGERRTGVTSYNQGVDADSLNKTATGITQIMNASAQRMELIARIFAETGVRGLGMAIFALATKYERPGVTIRVAGQFTPVDPTAWEHGMDVSVSAGLGTNNRDQMSANMIQVLQLQERAAGSGARIADESNIYNAAKLWMQSMGIKQVSALLTDPSQLPPPPPPEPDPRLMDVQLEHEREMAKVDVERQKVTMEGEKIEAELRLKERELDLKEREINLKRTSAATGGVA